MVLEYSSLSRSYLTSSVTVASFSCLSRNISIPIFSNRTGPKKFLFAPLLSTTQTDHIRHISSLFRCLIVLCAVSFFDSTLPPLSSFYCALVLGNVASEWIARSVPSSLASISAKNNRHKHEGPVPCPNPLAQPRRFAKDPVPSLTPPIHKTRGPSLKSSSFLNLHHFTCLRLSV